MTGQMLLGGCTICGGSGYVSAFRWQSTSAYDMTQRPNSPNELVPCNCLRMKWQRESQKASDHYTAAFLSSEPWEFT